jgi:hypothetical protein
MTEDQFARLERRLDVLTAMVGITVLVTLIILGHLLIVGR